MGMPLLLAFLMLLPLIPGADNAGATNTSPTDCSRGAVYSWSVQQGRNWQQKAVVQTYDFGCKHSSYTQRWAVLLNKPNTGGDWTWRGTDHAYGAGGNGFAQVTHSVGCGLRTRCKTYLGLHYEVIGQGPPDGRYPFANGTTG